MTLLFDTTQKGQFRSYGKRSLLFPNRHHRDAPNWEGTAMPVAADFRLAYFLTGQALGALKPLQHLPAKKMCRRTHLALIVFP